MPPMQSDYARQYENLWKRHWWWRARERFVRNWLSRIALHEHRPPETPRRILDIGCGNGLFFETLQRFGSVCGIEPDAALVAENGPHRRRIDVRPFDASYQPPDAVPFDWVLMLDVLEHLPDDHAAAAHVREILAPAGLFLLTVPALESLWSAHDDANLHFRRYTKASLKSVLELAGFEIQHLHYFFGWTIPPMLLRRLLSPGNKDIHARGRPGSGPAYHVTIPAGPVNASMDALSSIEQGIFGRIGLPMGSSLLAIARKPKAL